MKLPLLADAYSICALPVGLLLGCAALVLAGCNSETRSTQPAEVKRFVAEKRAQAQQLAGAQTNPIPRLTWRFFDAAANGNWNAVSNDFQMLLKLSGRSGIPAPPSKARAVIAWLGQLFGQNWGPRPSGLQSEVWAPISETYGVLDLERTWDAKWLEQYAREILQAMPEGSIYFGGTDAGRFAASCFSESHVEGRPILTLTQNALADGTYLSYLTSMYGTLMAVPTGADSAQAFGQYLKEAQRRLQENSLLTGENIRVNAGRVQVSGQTAVMEINALLVLKILEKNPGRECYLEESFVVKSLYPHMEPLGPIFRLQRTALEVVDENSIEANQAYWAAFLQQTLGDVTAAITNAQLAVSYLEGRPGTIGSGGGSSASFLRAVEARKAFAKLRGAQARWYSWRAENVADENERRRMVHAANLAFLQALILCPPEQLDSSPVLREYVDFLKRFGREEDVERIEGINRLSGANGSGN